MSTLLTNMKKARRQSRLSRGGDATRRSMRGKLAASRRASKTGPGPKSRFRPKPKPKPRGPKPKVKTSSAARRDTLRGGIGSARQHAAEPTAEQWAALEQAAVRRWGTMAHEWTARRKKAWASRNRVKTAEEVAEEVAENAAMYELLAEENALYEQRAQKQQSWHRLRGLVVAAKNERKYLQYAQARASLINATNGVVDWFGDYELEGFVKNLKVDAWYVLYISDEWAHRMWNNLMQVCTVANETKILPSGILDAKTQLRKLWESWFRDRANARTDRPKYLINESGDIAFTKAVLDSLPEALTAGDFNMLNGLQPTCNLGLALLHLRTRVQRLIILQEFILSFTAKPRPAEDWVNDKRFFLMNSYAHDRVRVQQLVHIGDTGLNQVARQTALDALRASFKEEIAAGCTTFAPLALDCYAPPKK